jgi:ethanolaminephosphotransferase
MVNRAETARHECVSEDALQHLRTYKYSSVDKSFISRYILKHYVRSLPPAHRNAI